MKKLIIYAAIFIGVSIFSINTFRIVKIIEDQFFFVVVSDFKVDYVDRDGDYIRLSGTMNKMQNCLFKSVPAYVSFNGKVRTLREVKFTETEHYVSRAYGQQAWGEWVIKVDDFDTLELYALHDCDGRYKLTKLIEMGL